MEYKIARGEARREGLERMRTDVKEMSATSFSPTHGVTRVTPWVV